MKAKATLPTLFAMFVAIGFAAAPPEPSAEVKAILDRTGNFKKPNFTAVQALTEEERQLLLAHFREQYRIAKSPEPLSNFSAVPENPVFRDDLRKRSETALAMLADPELMDRSLRDAKSAPAGTEELERAMLALSLAAKPEIVIEIAPFIMTNEPVTVTYIDDTRRVASKNLVAGYNVLKIIEQSSAFDPQTRKWAQDQTRADLVEVLKILPQWWRENEAHLVAKDYKAVKPGEDIYNPAREKSLREYEAMKARKAELNSKKAPMTAERTLIAGKTQPPSNELKEKNATTAVTVLPYAIIGGLVLLLASGVWLYSRSMKS